MYINGYYCYFHNRQLELFCKKPALKNFPKFTGDTYDGVIFIKVTDCRSAILAIL